MYTAFYGLSEKPFNMTPDPRFLYLTPSHREALSAMIYGIKERKGFIAVTGEVGTGKTTLIGALLSSLDKTVKTAFVYYTRTTFEQLLQNILLDLGVKTKTREKLDLLRIFNKYLLKIDSKGGTVVVIIDEAHNLSVPLLEEIRMLSNIETATTKLLQIVLVGQPELDERLGSRELRQLRQRVAVKTTISPLTPIDFREYIEYRLNIAGGKMSELFTDDALSLIFEKTSGFPRMVNIFCDNAFLIGYAKQSTRIDRAIVEEVAQDIGPEMTGQFVEEELQVEKSLEYRSGFLKAYPEAEVGNHGIPVDHGKREEERRDSANFDSAPGFFPFREKTNVVVAMTEKSSSDPETVDASFFRLLETELKKMIGPVAPIIIDEKVEEFGESKDTFPEDRIEDFVQSLADEIPNAVKRASFVEIVTRLRHQV